jgi:hypothetical protein
MEPAGSIQKYWRRDAEGDEDDADLFSRRSGRSDARRELVSDAGGVGFEVATVCDAAYKFEERARSFGAKEVELC